MIISETEIKGMIKECVAKILSEEYNMLTEGKLVDNFNMACRFMHFENTNSFYYVFIVKRKKDNIGQDFSKRGPDNRSNCEYLKSYVVKSPQELMSYKNEIVTMCNNENARAYMTSNPRDMQMINNYVQHCKNKGLFRGREFEHAAGQAKEYNDATYEWEKLRPYGLIDMDIPDKAAQKKLDDLLDSFNLKPVEVYESPNGGKHYIMPNRLCKYLNFSEFEKYRPQTVTRRASDPMVLFKGDAAILLYSNV